MNRIGLELFRNSSPSCPVQHSEIIGIICLASVSLLWAKPAISEMWLSGQRTENTERTATGLWLPSTLYHFTEHQQFSHLSFLWENRPSPSLSSFGLGGTNPPQPPTRRRNDLGLSQLVDSTFEVTVIHHLRPIHVKCRTFVKNIDKRGELYHSEHS